jgi:hypothetical protein
VIQTLAKFLVIIGATLFTFTLLFVQGFTNEVRERRTDAKVFEKNIQDHLGNNGDSTKKNTSISPDIISPKDVCITSGFSDLRSFNGKPARHQAVDIAGRNKNEEYIVKAANEGTVRIATLNGGFCTIGWNITTHSYKPHKLVACKARRGNWNNGERGMFDRQTFTLCSV